MAIRIVRALDLLAMLIVAGWCGREPHFEPFATLATLIAAYVVIEFKDNHNQDRLAADRALFSKLCEVLPQRSIMFLRDLTSMFHPEELEPFAVVHVEWRDAAHTFHDGPLESGRVKLLAAVQSFLAYISIETFRVAEHVQGPAPEWKTSDPERFKRVVSEMGKLADDVIDAHEALVRTAKKNLHV